MSDETKTTVTTGGKSAAASKGAATYTKNKLLTSKRYQEKRDLLEALLDDGVAYTRAEVDKRIAGYLNQQTEPAYKQRRRRRRRRGGNNQHASVMGRSVR